MKSTWMQFIYKHTFRTAHKLKYSKMLYEVKYLSITGLYSYLLDQSNQWPNTFRNRDKAPQMIKHISHLFLPPIRPTLHLTYNIFWYISTKIIAPQSQIKQFPSSCWINWSSLLLIKSPNHTLIVGPFDATCGPSMFIHTHTIDSKAASMMSMLLCALNRLMCCS